MGNGSSAVMVTRVPRQVPGWDPSPRDGNEDYKTFFVMAERGSFAVQFATEKVDLVPVNLRGRVTEGICRWSHSSRSAAVRPFRASLLPRDCGGAKQSQSDSIDVRSTLVIISMYSHRTLGVSRWRI